MADEREVATGRPVTLTAEPSELLRKLAGEPPLGRGLRLLLAALVAVGLAWRVSGLLGEERILQQFPTEDGYLMLTVARNIALGLGHSTAEGTLPTNGVQPLATWLYAGGFLLAGGDKTAGVALSLVLQIVIGAAAALMLLRLGRFLLAGRARPRATAALAAAAWWASPVALPHTMNGLESGLYVLVILVTLDLWVRAHAATPGPWSTTRCALLGVLLGLSFLARNDAVFLVLGVTVMHVLPFGAAGAGRATLGRRLAESTVMGVVSIAVTVPWLLFGVSTFGSIMPISGQSEAMGQKVFAEHLDKVPPALLEYVLAVLPIPHRLQGQMPAVLACTAVLVLLVPLFLRVVAAMSGPERRLTATVAVLAGGLFVFYGLFFGAGYFVPRYLFPLSPFLALSWAGVVLALWSRLPWPPLRVAAPVLLVLLVTGLGVRFWRVAVPHQHWQVVSWVEQHVPEDTWIGATQTGTLGFFHDRTINLDGKVNPEALAARKEGRIPEYVVEKGLQYVVDWYGHVTWHELHAPIRDNFDLVVADRDPGMGLCVLRRDGAPRKLED